MITQKCALLDHLEYSDVVLADRGFNVHDELALAGARLEIPSSTKGKTQLSRAEVEKSRRLASRVRIHMEFVIGQLRYKILQPTITLIKRPSDKEVATIDKILVVTAALTNLSQSVVVLISLYYAFSLLFKTIRESGLKVPLNCVGVRWGI